MPTLGEIAGGLDVVALDCAPPGEDAPLAERICTSARRQNVRLSGPDRVESADQLKVALTAVPQANCWLFVGGTAPLPWSWLPYEGPNKLLLAYSGGSSTPPPRADFRTRYPWAQLAIVSKLAMTAHEAGLFFPELLAELTTHCPTAITPALVRFCFMKAIRLAPGKAEIWS